MFCSQRVDSAAGYLVGGAGYSLGLSFNYLNVGFTEVVPTVGGEKGEGAYT